jgi:hypothetical protein
MAVAISSAMRMSQSGNAGMTGADWLGIALIIGFFVLISYSLSK